MCQLLASWNGMRPKYRVLSALRAYDTCTYHANVQDTISRTLDHMVALITHCPYDFTDGKYDDECIYMYLHDQLISAAMVWLGINYALIRWTVMRRACVTSMNQCTPQYLIPPVQAAMAQTKRV